MKFECRQQIIDGEVESYKLRLNQMNTEKDDLLKIIKDLEKKYRDLHIKSDTDEKSWTRVKKEMSDKQRKVKYSLQPIGEVHFLFSTTKVLS